MLEQKREAYNIRLMNEEVRRDKEREEREREERRLKNEEQART